MFGHHKAKRAKKRLKKESEALNEQKAKWEADSPQRQKEASDLQKSQVEEKANQSKEDRKQGYAEGRKRVQDLYADESIHGLDPEKRKAMQYAANQQIHRGHQAANRKLLGEQAQRGVVGKGGVGFAQQKELQKMAMDAEGSANRDLTNLDADLRLKNIAAIFAGEQGEASQNQLDKQMALDELKYEDEKKRNRNFEDYAYKQFSRI
jgi:hypothetical protein